MRKKVISLLILVAILWTGIFNVPSVNAESTRFTEFRNVDKRTFNEYRYKLTKEFLLFEQKYEVNNKIIDVSSARRIMNLVKTWYKFLPDDLTNDSLKLKLITKIQKGIANPEDEYNYADIKKGIRNFISNAKIKEMTWTLDATPTEGNAPLITTLRANIKDPSWVNIPKSAYVWWMDYGYGRRKIIGTGPFISKRFTIEWNYTVFLDVRSSHKNQYGNSDIIPFSWKIEIKVQEKIASIVMRVSWKKIPENDEIKFSPETARYWLIFDATSSIPATWTRFIETYWDFGNGVAKKYSWRPKMERVVYTKEWDYDVVLKVKTNRWRVVDKKFKVFVHNPVAVIDASATEWYMWDNFTFQTKVHGRQKWLTFLWEIYDVDREKIVRQKSGKKLDHIFKNKWRFSVRLKITDNVWNVWLDTKTIYINSQKPVPSFKSKMLLKSKPNEIYFDATSTFDPDDWDDGHLTYSWIVDGIKINLSKSNLNNSTWYYTFDSVWEHSVILEVEDPDGISATSKWSVQIKSLLSLDFLPAPRVIQRNKKIRFLANSKNARFYEWDFGDWERKSLETNKISHAYSESWIYSVVLKVRWTNNDENTLTKLVYIWDSNNPVAILDLWRGQWWFNFKKESWACEWNEAYIVSRADSINLSSKESIDTNGKTSGLSVSWKIWESFIDKPSLTHKFDDLWCFKIKLIVKSKKDKTTDSKIAWVKVENLKPELLQLKIEPISTETDPVIVKVKTVWAKDRDGVIKSYLWFYTTDLDSSPQDFKITRKWSTSFVVPKIPWNYHFWVILKDNNDAKINSDDVIWKNTLMLSWDNTNTPLIDFSVSKASVAIWDTITFRAKSTNILGKSIEKASKFFWDFDWDWFYEKETDIGRITHKYKKSWVFYAKVKVRHKGYSNTRTATISVVNRLVSNFDYVSIWNKYIFIDKSRGAIDNYKWDLWDWEFTKNKKKFVYKYDDNKPIHTVELTVSEWTKTKKIKKIVKKDLRNVLKTRKNWINIFTFPAMKSKNTIILDEEESVFIYLWESKWTFTNYGIDYDINIDTNLNWWKDDDIDNKHNLSYTRGDPDEIILNKSRVQNIRVFLLDKDWHTIDSKDIIIEKTYIKEENIVEVWIFELVSEDIKIKFENLKYIIKSMPQEHRMMWMKYVQKLKDEWKDETERTRTIMDFEGFIDGTWVENVDEIIELLESLIITEWGDNWEKAVAFAALKALIPKEIQCKTAWENCKEFLISNLEKINKSFDEKVNREIWKKILQVGIKNAKVMNEEEKADFKAILKVLIYSEQGKIPDKEVKEVIEDDIRIDKNEPTKVDKPTVWEPWEDWKLTSYFKSVWKWALWILWVIIFWMFVFWIIDFIKNRKSWESFEDFDDNNIWDDDILEDVLSDEKPKKKDPLASTEEKKSWIFSEEKTSSVDPLASTPVKEDIKQVESKSDIDPLSAKEESTVPDWLSNTTKIKSESPDSILEKKPVIKENIPKVEVLKEEENVWFSLSDPSDNIKDEKIEKTETFNIDEETKEEDSVPDWLQDSVTDELPKKNEETEEEFLDKQSKDIPEKIEEELEPEIIEDKIEEGLDLENDIPDWLKSWDDEAEEEEENNSSELISGDNIDKIVKSEPENKPDLTEFETKKENIESKIEWGSEIKSSDDNIPDWLKGSVGEESNNGKEEEIKKEANSEWKKDSKKKIKKEKLDEADVPDWLKDSVKETNSDAKKTENIKKETKKTENIKKETKKTENIKKETKKSEEKNKKSDSKESVKTEKLDDWDVDIPDWLKG